MNKRFIAAVVASFLAMLFSRAEAGQGHPNSAVVDLPESIEINELTADSSQNPYNDEQAFPTMPSGPSRNISIHPLDLSARAQSEEGFLSYEEYGNRFNAAMTLAVPLLRQQKGIVNIEGVTAVVGDLHGDVYTLREIISILGSCFESSEKSSQINNVVFLGDLMDRGPENAKTLLELLEFFNKYPGKVYILKGNHETKEVFNGFAGDSPARDDGYFSTVNKEHIYNFFDLLPYAAIINGSVLAVHGGVPQENFWENFKLGVKHSEEISPLFNPIKSALWSDYDPLTDCLERPIITGNPKRGGSSICFNELMAKKFLDSMNLKYMIRGHQPELGSFHRSTNGIITTVFSALENQSKIIAESGAKIAAVLDSKNPPMDFATIIIS